MQTRLSPAPEYGKLTVTELEHRFAFVRMRFMRSAAVKRGTQLNDWLEAKAEVLGVVAKPKAA